MNTAVRVESAWKTYPKLVLFLFPAVAAYLFSCIYLVPRLKEIWWDAGFEDATANALLVLFLGWANHVFIYGLVLAGVLVLLECCSPAWRRHRRLVLGLGAFFVNTAVLFFLTALLTYGLLAVSR